MIRVYLPPDANTLLSVADHCLRSRQYVNVIVAGKQPALKYLGMDEAIVHAPGASGSGSGRATRGRRARRRHGLRRRRAHAGDACCGVAPARASSRPEGPGRQRRRSDAAAAGERASARLSDAEFDALFTTDKPVIFAYHGYPWLIHRLTYRRTNHANLHVRGYKEEGTTTTPFDMVMLNDLDRFHLAMDVIDRVPRLAAKAGRPKTAHGPTNDSAAAPGRANTAKTARTCATGPGQRAGDEPVPELGAADARAAR